LFFCKKTNTKQSNYLITKQLMHNQIHPDAQIGQNVQIGSFSVIEANVTIGDNCRIGSNVHVFSGARIGDGVQIFPFASISAPAQALREEPGDTFLEIGSGSVIREACTLNRGVTRFGGRTSIGQNTLLMAYVHVAHDCHVGHQCVLANNVTLAGHIEVGDYATLGGMVAVHQFVRIGEQVMLGGGSLVRKDVPPFITAAREPLAYLGINSVGLRRRNFTSEQMHHIEDIYRILFVRGYSVRKALERIDQEIEPSPFRERILDFVRTAKRGMIRGPR
jgi:UDP-N-acetylglucosamine acyltransferase